MSGIESHRMGLLQSSPHTGVSGKCYGRRAIIWDVVPPRDPNVTAQRVRQRLVESLWATRGGARHACWACGRSTPNGALCRPCQRHLIGWIDRWGLWDPVLLGC